MSIYFVTGGSGAVGSGLVPRLLHQDPTAAVYLLLRAGSAEQLELRLQSLYDFWRIERADHPTRARIDALRGDVTAPQLGLAPAQYAQLAETCTHIVHCAGQVRMNLPLAEARRQAVDAARNVLALGDACQRSGRLEKIELVSTVGVAGRIPDVLEEDWITRPRSFHNSYEAAKAEAELYVAQKVADGMPITVHRPSMVVGESTTGRIIHFQVFYHLCEFLSGQRSWGFCPQLGAHRLDIIPVDYVASALAWSSRQQSTAGRVMHLCSGPDDAIPLAELRDRVRDSFSRSGIRLPAKVSLPPAAFRVGLPLLTRFASERHRRVLNALLPIFLDYLSQEQSFTNCRTVELLEPAGISVPPVATYLPLLLSYYLTVTGR